MASHANIPLHCNICPRKPNFSDVSHLLTHISSKGHLSNYYKAKVKSANEDATRLLVEAYDRWYAEWNVEELMSDRMNQKDQRRTRTRPSARPTPTPKIEVPMPRNTRRTAAGNLLDPRLTEQHFIKVEPDCDTSASILYSGPVLRHRPLAPHLQCWGSDSRGSSMSHTNPEYETSSEYSEPVERRSRRGRQPAADTCAVEDEPIEAVADSMAVTESTKLKGVYWPGMDLFDSATPEMRRKRNQKKDSSVLEQLELNSQDVEATEIIFTPRGSFKRQRRISSSFYDDEEESEIKMESPRQTLARPALATLNPNIPRHSQQSQLSDHSHLSANQYEERGRLGSEYSYGDCAPRRKRAFDVYQDEEVSFNQPAKFRYLTAGYSHQLSPSPVPSFAPFKPASDPFQFADKENVFGSIQQSAYGNPHNHPFPGYHPHPYTFGMGVEQDFQYNNFVLSGNPMYQHQPEDDDQRTITAPPSPVAS